MEKTADDDEIPLVYLKNNVSPLELKKTEGLGRYSMHTIDISETCKGGAPT